MNSNIIELLDHLKLQDFIFFSSYLWSTFESILFNFFGLLCELYFIFFVVFGLFTQVIVINEMGGPQLA